MQKAKNLRKHLHTLWYAFKTSTSTAVREVSPLQKCFWQERRKFHQSPFCQDFVSLNNIADLPGARKQVNRLYNSFGSLAVPYSYAIQDIIHSNSHLDPYRLNSFQTSTFNEPHGTLPTLLIWAKSQHPPQSPHSLQWALLGRAPENFPYFFF